MKINKMTDYDLAGQAGAHPRGSERADAGRRGHAAMRASARRCRRSGSPWTSGRACARDVASRAARGGQVRGGVLAGAGRQAAVRAARHSGAAEARLARRRRRPSRARSCCSRTCASTRARRRTPTSLAHEDGGALRRVRHGRVRHGAPRRGEHARRRALRAHRLRGPAAGQRADALETRAREAGAAAGRDRRRAPRCRPSSPCSSRCSRRSTS